MCGKLAFYFPGGFPGQLLDFTLSLRLHEVNTKLAARKRKSDHDAKHDALVQKAAELLKKRDENIKQVASPPPPARVPKRSTRGYFGGVHARCVPGFRVGRAHTHPRD